MISAKLIQLYRELHYKSQKDDAPFHVLKKLETLEKRHPGIKELALSPQYVAWLEEQGSITSLPKSSKEAIKSQKSQFAYQTTEEIISKMNLPEEPVQRKLLTREPEEMFVHLNRDKGLAMFQWAGLVLAAALAFAFIFAI